MFPIYLDILLTRFTTGTNATDTLIGGADTDLTKDFMNGLGGDDLLQGKGGNDTLLGGTGNDTTIGGAGHDSLKGEAGNDYLVGDYPSQDPSLHPVANGNDTLWGGTGNDFLDGGAGNDFLDGETDDDFLYGGDGNDVIWGGSGNDSLYGGRGDDTLLGGTGADVFFLKGSEADLVYDDATGQWLFIGDYGLTVLADYNAAAGDRIEFIQPESANNSRNSNAGNGDDPDDAPIDPDTFNVPNLNGTGGDPIFMEFYRYFRNLVLEGTLTMWQPATAIAGKSPQAIRHLQLVELSKLDRLVSQGGNGVGQPGFDPMLANSPISLGSAIAPLSTNSSQDWANSRMAGSLLPTSDFAGSSVNDHFYRPNGLA